VLLQRGRKKKMRREGKKREKRIDVNNDVSMMSYDIKITKKKR
jgi:hypothetical protein